MGNKFQGEFDQDEISARDVHIEDYDAYECSDGSWLHNDGDVYWYNELGEVHREDGPAVIQLRSDIFDEWFLNDRQYSFYEWCKELNKTDGEKMLLRLQYG